MKKLNLLVFIRIIIGCIYIVSGAEKLVQPYENFLYVIQEYKMLNYDLLERIVAWSFPWVEFILGIFLVLGLWLRITLCGIGLFTTVFIVVVGQAIFRNLPITECGCFGNLVSVPLPVVLFMDSLILILIIIQAVFMKHTAAFSLDNYFFKRE